MDYTLCEYNSPAMDVLAFELAKEFLVSTCGHPEEISGLLYDSGFPVRGSLFDRQLGNLLLVDRLGHILQVRVEHSHWSRLVEIMVLLRQHSFTIKNQLKASKAPY